MIIVTGGAGFIGSNLVKGLNNIGLDNIVIVDNLKNSEKHLNLNSLEFKDIMDKEDFIKNIDKMDFNSVDTIFHQGACSNTMEYDGIYMMKNNYEYSKTLLNKAIESGTRFIYASSASVYGNGDNGFVEKKECEYPMNIYAYSKFLFDKYVKKQIKKIKIQVVGLRYFNVYGPQENHKNNMASVVFHFYNQIKKENRIKIFKGSENFKRDFVFVDDIIKINLHFLNNPDIKGIFNCGTGEAKSFCKIAEIMNNLYPDSNIKFIHFPEKLKGKYQEYTQADLTNLRDDGKYDKPFNSLDEGVTKYASLLKDSNGYYR